MSASHPALRYATTRWAEILSEAALDPANPWRLACLRALPVKDCADDPSVSPYLPRLMRDALKAEDPSAICNLIPGLRATSPAEAFEFGDRLVSHPSACVRLALAQAMTFRKFFFREELGDLNPDHAIQLLEVLARDADPDVAWTALAHLDFRGACPDDFQIPPPPTAETAIAMAQDGFPRRRALWQKGLEVSLLKAIEKQLLLFKNNPGCLDSPWILLLVDWMRLGGPEVIDAMRKWLESENATRRTMAALMLGIQGHPIESEDLHQLSLAVSPLPDGEIALRELLERASMTGGDIDTALLALTWRALWDPKAHLACERLNTPYFSKEDEEIHIAGTLFVEDSNFEGIPYCPRDPSRMSLLSALEPPLPSEAPSGVPRHLAIKAQALLAMAQDPEPSRAAWALGKLMMRADGPWLEAPMAAALCSTHPYLQTVGLLYLKKHRRVEELIAAKAKASFFVLKDLQHLIWLDPQYLKKDKEKHTKTRPKERYGDKIVIPMETLQKYGPWELGDELSDHPMAGTLPMLQAALGKVEKGDGGSRYSVLTAISRCPDEGARELLAKALPLLPWDLQTISIQSIMNALEAANGNPFWLQEPIRWGRILGLLKNQEVLQRLVSWAHSSDLIQRSEAVEGLALHPSPKCVKHLIALTNDPHPGLARKAIRALGYRPEPKAVEYLEDQMERIDPAPRKAAALGLLLSGPKEGSRLLQMTLERLEVPEDQMPFKGLADFGRELLRLV